MGILDKITHDEYLEILDSISNAELVQLIKDRSLEYRFTPNLWNYPDKEIEQEYLNRGLGKHDKLYKMADNLYTTYMTCTRDLYEKNLKQFFNFVVDKK